MNKLHPFDAFLVANNLRQFQAAKKLRIAPGHLSMILTGLRQPRLPLAVRMAKMAGIPIESLLEIKPRKAVKRTTRRTAIARAMKARLQEQVAQPVQVEGVIETIVHRRAVR